jgi:hypothetical protein
MRPLKGWARWLLFPALSIAAGGLAGYGVDLLIGAPDTPLFAMLGSTLAGAAAAGTVMPGPAWVGYLVAPMLTLAGVANVRAGREPGGWLDALLSTLKSPASLALVFMATGILLGLHRLRLASPDRPLKIAVFYVAAGALNALGAQMISGTFHVAFAGGFVLLHLTAFGALEAALRVSRC